MREMKPNIIVPGHGRILKGYTALDEYIQFFKDFRTIIKDALSEGIPPNKVEIPTPYEPISLDFKNVSINHWYNFYKKEE